MIDRKTYSNQATEFDFTRSISIYICDGMLVHVDPETHTVFGNGNTARLSPGQSDAILLYTGEPKSTSFRIQEVLGMKISSQSVINHINAIKRKLDIDLDLRKSIYRKTIQK